MAVNFVVKLAVTAAMTAAQMALTMSRKIEGPRLDNLDVTVADYGTVIPRLWGIRRFEAVPIIWAEKLRERKVRSKTKGGKYDEYKYYGTWAVLLTDTPIDAVTRIWFDKHLVYQTTGPGPVSSAPLVTEEVNGNIVKLTAANMRIYLGTEDQNPDPRMETWCEERYGADSCPAYRGSSYIVFEDLPLEKLGNRIPQISVEVVRSQNEVYPKESIDTFAGYPTSGTAPIFSRDFSYLFFGDDTGYSIIDIPTRTEIMQGTLSTAGVQELTDFKVSRTGDVYAAGQEVFGPFGLVRWGNLGQGAPGLVSEYPGGAALSLFVCSDNEGYEHFVSVNGNEANVYSPDFNTTSTVETDFYCIFAFGDAHGDAWVAGKKTGENVVCLQRVYQSSDRTVDYVEVPVVSAPASDILAGHFSSASTEHFVIFADKLYLADVSTGAVLATSTGDIGNLRPAFYNRRPTDPFIHGAFSTNAFRKWSAVDASYLGPTDLAPWSPPQNFTDGIYDPVNNAWLGIKGSGEDTTWFYLDRIGSDGVTLSTIIDDVCEWAGVEGQDTSDCTQLIKGYSVSQGAAKDMIAPLLDAYDVDARPHDFIVQFLPRGTASGGTIDVAEFVREGDSPRYTASIMQDADLPLRIAFNFADFDKSQQTNTAVFQREATTTDSRRETTIDLTTLVMTADEAQPLVERFGRRIWNERGTVTLGLTPMHLGLEPGDVWTLGLDGANWTCRLQKMTATQGAINTEWRRDYSSLNTLSTTEGAPLDARDDEVIFIPGPARGFVIDTPLFADINNDVNPLLYFAAGGYSSTTFSGAQVYRGDDGTYDEAWGGIDSSDASTWGYVTNELPTANPWLWDRGNELTVNLASGGTLNTATEAEIDEDPTLNLVAIGKAGRWELVQFATATIVSGNTWTVSGLKRGRRGTEGNVANHQAGDEFVLLTSTKSVKMSLSDLSDALSFKVAAVGRTVAASPPIDLTFTAATLKPYAPARIIWSTDGTDLLGTIIRRTRIGGLWNGGTTIPLGENSEAYEVDVLSGGGAVLRTISVSGTNSFTITAAQLAADGYSLTTRPPVNAYQLSDSVGRGFALAA